VFNHTGRITLTNSTLSGNTAAGGSGGSNGSAGAGGGSGLGGAIFNLNGVITINHSTLASNTVSAGAGGPGGSSGSAAGGAIYSRKDGGSAASVTLKNSLLVNTSGGVNCANTGGGAFTSTGYNLADDNTCSLTIPGDLPSTDPGLGPLADNGGSVQTHALLAGSPAFNAGDPTFAPPPDFDGRGPGFSRLLKGRLDIGAYESSLDVLVNLVLSKQVTPDVVGPGQYLTYTLIFSNVGLQTATGVVIGDAVPVTVTNLSLVSSGVILTQTSGPPVYTWQAQDLATNQGGVMTMTGLVSPNLTVATVFTNTASITATESETEPGNNTATAVVMVASSERIFLPIIVK
jgi:uncharacterized repeat protein (TIGR01451 family)